MWYSLFHVLIIHCITREIECMFHRIAKGAQLGKPILIMFHVVHVFATFNFWWNWFRPSSYLRWKIWITISALFLVLIHLWPQSERNFSVLIKIWCISIAQIWNWMISPIFDGNEMKTSISELSLTLIHKYSTCCKFIELHSVLCWITDNPYMEVTFWKRDIKCCFVFLIQT